LKQTHQTIFVDFDETDRKEYDALEATAKGYYRSMKAQNKGVHLSRHFLKLTHMLKPMRIACAGGKIPLDEPKKAKEEIGSDGEDDMDEELEEGHKKKKEKQFSKHAFTSKLLTLVTELERIRTEEPNAKSLVFSQFGSTLTWLQGELPKHGFQFRTLSGDMSMKKRAKALADFQHDPPTTIFLLSMRAGAVGINLTQANRVFLMEPCFNPALEAQAIGRVYRLGQKHNVEIIRLIIKDSVESRMITMLEEKFGANTYGNGDAANTADDDDDDDSVDDGDKKPKAVATSAPVLVGSLTTDRAAVVAEEFDLLYGLDPAEEGEQEANQDPGVGLANMFGLALGSGGGSGDDDDLSVADI
jgi:SNF2 family DNA or RNA helicase